MQYSNPYYVVTHQELPWTLSFEHKILGIEGFSPKEKHGITNSAISKMLDLETALGSLRSLMAINNDLQNYQDSQTVFVGTYRLFLGKEINYDWLSPIMQENKIVTPEEMTNNWRDIISTELPDGVDIIVPAPRLLPDTLLGQYSRVHHLDDLLFATGCAVRSGLLESNSVSYMLNSNTLIPYGNFAAAKHIRKEFNEKLWSCVLDFYKNYYIPRFGYQRRVIDFVFERIISMALIQLVLKRKYKCVSARNIWISKDQKYIPSM